MDADHRDSAAGIRSLAERGQLNPAQFRAALTDIPLGARDAWVDAALGLGEPPADGPDLPRGCVPYLPCGIDALLRLVAHAPVHASDRFVDIGSGLGRAAAVVHLLTGAAAVGIEVQPALVLAAREMAQRLRLPDVSFVHGDAADLPASGAAGSVFLLYCPFSGDRLRRLFARLERVARTRPIRVCCVDLPLPPCPWLQLKAPPSLDLVIHRSTCFG